MSRKSILALWVALCATTGCSSSQTWMPLSSAAEGAELTLVWVGRGECERLEQGVWVRRPEYDYELTVEQRRSRGRWESVKSLRRLHPAYDGGAGERAQTYFFRQELAAPDAAGTVHGSLTSSLGNGSVRGDVEMRTVTLELSAAGVSKHAPFDRYRISQRYDYEQGKLGEVVELNKGDQPWVRNRESATLYAPHRFESAPTRVTGGT